MGERAARAERIGSATFSNQFAVSMSARDAPATAQRLVLVLPRARRGRRTIWPIALSAPACNPTTRSVSRWSAAHPLMVALLAVMKGGGRF